MPLKSGRAPTIHLVAKLAGVSVATVSRTLKNPEKVQPETRGKVMKAVAATGFVPNAQARIFRRRTSDTVILLVREISNPFYLEIYKGVEEAADDAGYKVLMGDARNDEQRIVHYVDMVRERHADGLILITGRLPEVLRADLARLPPIVVACEFLRDVSLPTVCIDNIAAARVAMDHLIGLGHRRIAHITGPIPEVLSEDRLQGYREALAAANIAFDPALVVRGDFTLKSGRAAIRALLDSDTRFTALFSSNDEMAVGAINELRLHGLEVPHDISVVGFDDTMFAETVEPPLTTIHQPQRDIGRLAMKMMIRRLSGESEPDRPVLLDTRLVVRGTTRECVAGLVALPV
jgi:LacI family repressor for deo operon, udp, cdd, tsx, nupC, and nupG